MGGRCAPREGRHGHTHNLPSTLGTSQGCRRGPLELGPGLARTRNGIRPAICTTAAWGAAKRDLAECGNGPRQRRAAGRFRHGVPFDPCRPSPLPCPVSHSPDRSRGGCGSSAGGPIVGTRSQSTTQPPSSSRVTTHARVSLYCREAGLEVDLTLVGAQGLTPRCTVLTCHPWQLSKWPARTVRRGPRAFLVRMTW